MDIPKINLHIHSSYSDGTNNISEIIKKAISYNLNYVAVTDHFTNSWKAKIIVHLNSKDKIANYLEDITKRQQYLNQNKINLKLFKGIEIDISSSQNYILSLINPYKFDIILFEYLENPEGIAFIKNIVKNWRIKYKPYRAFPILGLAHLDPSFFIYSALAVLINFLKEYNIYFEFNSSYSQYYSVKYKDFFIKLAKEKLLIGIGCDSHDLKSLNNIEEPLKVIQEYGLLDNLITLINILKSKPY
ncbi:MAG: PHP domain-containing protein [Promethearchaeota archaeon]